MITLVGGVKPVKFSDDPGTPIVFQIQFSVNIYSVTTGDGLGRVLGIHGGRVDKWVPFVD